MDDKSKQKAKKSQYNKTYYDKHRKNVLDYLTAKITCECGSTVSRVNLNAHKKTKKHSVLLTSQNQNPVQQTQ